MEIQCGKGTEKVRYCHKHHHLYMYKDCLYPLHCENEVLNNYLVARK